MKIDVAPFRLQSDAKISLPDLPTRIEPVYKDEHDYARLLKDHIAALSDRQDRLFAARRQSLLIIFQAMDAAGKDGAIKHVMSGVNPQGCQVYSFSHPAPTELEHDFLWRYQPCLPGRGRIGIFNRSYYEEVLITRVHPEILFTEERVELGSDPKSTFEGRYDSIRNFEAHLHRSDVRIVKIFLHLSK